MLGWSERRQPGPQVSRGLPQQRDLRVVGPMPGQPPRQAAAGDVRGNVGHTGIQQQGRLAGRWVPAFRLQHGRQVSFAISQLGCHSREDPANHHYRTGYSWHGDYLFGWKGDALQHALDIRCAGDACQGMKTQTADQANQCMIKSTVNEDVDGCKCPDSTMRTSTRCLRC